MNKKQTTLSGNQVSNKAKYIVAIIGALATIIAAIIAVLPIITKNDLNGQHNSRQLKTKLVGRIINIDTKIPIADAEVILEADDIPSVTHTDSKGIFSFPIAKNTREVRIRVQSSGYETFNQRLIPSSNSGIEDIRIRPLKKHADSKKKNRVPQDREISDPIEPSDNQPEKKMITVRLVIDNKLRNGEVFVDGKQVLSTTNTIVREIKVAGFMHHDIMVATETESCVKSGYFDTENETILIQCN